MTWPANPTPNTARQTAASAPMDASGPSPTGQPEQAAESSSVLTSATDAERPTSSASAISAAKTAHLRTMQTLLREVHIIASRLSSATETFQRRPDLTPSAYLCHQWTGELDSAIHKLKNARAAASELQVIAVLPPDHQQK